MSFFFTKRRLNFCSSEVVFHDIRYDRRPLYLLYQLYCKQLHRINVFAFHFLIEIFGYLYPQESINLGYTITIRGS